MTETETDRIDIKPRYSLIPTDVLEAVATVLTYGAIKHDEDDFTHCTTRTVKGEFDALMRHWATYMSGSIEDDETGLHPTVHMAARAIILCHLALREDS